MTLPVVTTWADNKTAAVSFTMDDNSVEAGQLYEEEFQKYGIHGTSMIIANNTTNTNYALTEQNIADWNEIFSRGYFDLGSHSMTHGFQYTTGTSAANLTSDITDSREYLLSKFPGQKLLTFASPWGASPANAKAEMAKAFYANRSATNGEAKATPTDWFNLPAYCVLYGTTASAMNGWVDSAITNGGWCIELYHGLGDTTSDATAYKTNPDAFKTHMQYIGETKKDEVWAGSFTEVTQYIYERNAAQTAILWVEDDSVGIKLADGLDNELFDYPLTLKVNLPSSWSGSVTCSQGGKSFETEILTENGLNYAYVNTVPNAELMTISLIK